MRETLKNQHFSHLIIMPQTGIERLRTLENRIERRIVPPLLIAVQYLYNFFVQTESADIRAVTNRAYLDYRNIKRKWDVG